MRINGMLALAAGLVLLVASAAQAADIAATIQARYEKLRTFSATFEQTLTHKESGSVEKRQGSLLFQKPLLIRWQTDKPHEETLVVTHKEIWDYLADEEISYRYPLELVRDSRTIIQVITGQAALTKDFDVKEAGQENGFAKLHLYPKEPAPQMVEALLWVEPSTGYIRRASIIDFYGNSNDVRFTQFKPDTSLKESDFTFTAPKGVEVEDRIDRKVQEKELFK
ncbi:outer membrane lipoprotein chaperone LolA [Desulfovibrio desulfuricans]|uniref:outer membrane lipoprotein chaperone LolA n=1 Tax=Desulfovibrio desulfuricans TaxID=876 RepID=UPI001AE44182|nr:outer membrane lipoprotein chaperone LolA [Desulfovibrio desulfuricans]QTO39179.1 outer membrane lipoprotein chaperone LolA [Desulfovibrio desulfuricans]